MPQFPAVISLATLDGTDGFRLNGVDPRDLSGASVASADVNGDGFDDLIIGAFGGDPGFTNAGETYVVFGKPSNFAAIFELATLDGSNGFRIDGARSLDDSGYSVASAGDVNGDGFEDLIIGINLEYPRFTTEAGAAYVVFGKASFSASISLAGLNGTNGFRLDGIDPDDRAGRHVSSAGDLNGDGFDDLLIGTASGNFSGGKNAGEAYVVFGSGAPFAAATDLATLDGANGFRLDGVSQNDFAGWSVAAAGDVNGDGLSDMMVAAIWADPGFLARAGKVYVVYGNGSGFAASIDLSTIGGSNGFRVDGLNSGDSLGITIASAGDVNGDGIDDLIFGTNNEGSYVVFGKGPSSGGFGAAFDLATLDGTNGFYFGHDARGVASAGDVNGDGFDDIIFASYGGAFVVFGKASGFSATLTAASLNGNNGFRIDSSSGHSVSSAGDVNGDGFADLLIGSPSGSPGGRYTAGETSVVFGHRALTAVTIAGTSQGLTHNGGYGNDTINALGGADTVRGWEGDDALNGGTGDDNLDGGSGIDMLDGGTGNDAMEGGLGNDTYIVDALGDVIAEALNEGVDTVHAGVNWRLGVNLEKLYLDGSAIAGTGNALSNYIYGNAAGNTLDGAAGADRLLGGLGNDIYIVDSSGDLVFENAGEGTDTVRSSVNHMLAANIERLTLTGAGNVNATGNDQANLIVGNAGNNFIDGKLGSDSLTGGLGKDNFLFTTALGNTNIDTITDFSVADDYLRLDDAIFTALSPGYLAAGAFRTGASAADASDRIVYNAANGALYYDADGLGGAAQIRIATIGAGLAMTNADIYVF